MAASRIETAPADGVLACVAETSRKIVVERRSLGTGLPRPSVLITLPSPRLMPPRLWISRAVWDVRLKWHRRVRGQVRVSIAFGLDSKARLDVLARAVVDLLTATALIDGDGPHVLKELTLRWGLADNVQILIEPWSQSA